MLWKSPRQRKAVMALLTKVRKRAKSVRIAPSVLSQAEMETVMSPHIAKKLIARLPSAHQSMSKMEKIEISDRFLGGFADRHVGSWNPEGIGKKKNLLRVSRKLENYMKEVGYTSKPSHVPGGYWAYKAHTKKEISPEARKRYTLRNARLGATKAFYHEYGHSVWSGANEQLRSIWSRSANIRGEWYTGQFPRPMLDPAESFAEAYTQYATSKVSKARLRRERPVSYSAVASFFEHGESFAP